MQIPSHLKVGGHVYAVVLPHRFTETTEYCGQANHQVLEIRLAAVTQGGEPRPQSKIEETFLHELLHCVDQTFNAGGLDEKTVDRLSEGLYTVLTDNGLLKE
jgi:hypothetical protein